MEREAKGVIAFKGSVSDVKKVFDALTISNSPNYILRLEGGHAFDTFKVGEYGVRNDNVIELNLEPKNFEYVDLIRQVEDPRVIESVVSLFEPVIKEFPSVSFLISFKLMIDDFFDFGGGYYCAYKIIENGKEKEKNWWVWETQDYQGGHEDDCAKECEYYTSICKLRYDWIEKQSDVWLLEGRDDAALSKAEKALKEAAEKADAADIPYKK